MTLKEITSIGAMAIATIGAASCSSTQKTPNQVKTEASRPNTLSGRWAIKDASGYSTNGSPNETYIEFDGKGGINGCTGANMFFGSCDSGNGMISIEGVRSSRMSVGPYQETEQAVIRALREAKNFKTDGGTATLRDASGREVMRLEKD